MKKILMFAIFGMFFISLASASTCIFHELDTEINFTVTCENGENSDGYCSASAFCPINIIDPSSNVIVSGENMTDYGTIFAYNFTTNQTGRYSIAGFCRDGELQKKIDTCIQVTPNGEEFTNGKAISYIGFILILFVIFGLSLYGSLVIPWKHVRTEEGYIIGINEMRYVKLTLWALNYILLMFLFGLSYKFFREAGIDGFTQFFNWAYQIMLAFIYPTMIATIIFMVMAFLASKRLRQQLERGISIR